VESRGSVNRGAATLVALRGARPASSSLATMAYAIISLGGKQYRVQEGERLLVDRLKQEEGNTLTPAVLLVGGGDGPTQMSPTDVTVTARVVRHLRGEKIVIGKYKQRTGYRRNTGFRAALTQIEIEAIGKAKAAAPKKEAEPKAEKQTPKPEAPKGLPQGYGDMTVAEVKEGSDTWNRPMLEAALEYEQVHAKRKGAIAALESAIARKEED
jgi:large subunit ribosomal protein L21